jgi:hypothetical protein
MCRGALRCRGTSCSTTTTGYGIEKVAFYISRVPALIVWNVDDLLVRCGSTVERQALADELRAAARAA